MADEPKRRRSEDVIPTKPDGPRPATEPEPTPEPTPEPAASAPAAAQPVAPNLKESEVVQLSEPVVIGGVKVNQLTVRKPRVRDMLAVDRLNQPEFTGQVRLLAQVAGCAPGELDDMNLNDFQKLSQVLSSFMPALPNPTS
jgi:hypothetical protein